MAQLFKTVLFGHRIRKRRPYSLRNKKKMKFSINLPRIINQGSVCFSLVGSFVRPERRFYLNSGAWATLVKGWETLSASHVRCAICPTYGYKAYKASKLSYGKIGKGFKSLEHPLRFSHFSSLSCLPSHAGPYVNRSTPLSLRRHVFPPDCSQQQTK